MKLIPRAHCALILLLLGLSNYVFFLYADYFFLNTGIDVKNLLFQIVFYNTGPHLLVMSFILTKYFKTFVNYHQRDSNNIVECIKNGNKWVLLGGPCLEEVVFRYILPQHLMLFLSNEHSILISSIGFGLIHYKNTQYEEKEGVRHFSSWIMGFSHVVSAGRTGHLIATNSSFVVGTFLHYWFDFLLISAGVIAYFLLNMIQRYYLKAITGKETVVGHQTVVGHEPVLQDEPISENEPVAEIEKTPASVPFKFEDLKEMLEEHRTFREHTRKMKNVFKEMGIA